MAQGEPSALAEFGRRFGALTLELTHRVLAGVQPETATQIARGVLQVCVDQLPLVHGAFAESEAALESWVAIVCGRALHEARAGHELQSAAVYALQLLPQDIPTVEHFGLTAYYRPSSWLSGDYYDVVRREDGSLLALIADVMGHGAPAALLVSAVKCAFRMNASAPAGELVLNAMNAALNGVLPSGCFAVASLLVLGPDRGEVALANAGLEGATVGSRREKRLKLLELPGLPLGLFEDASYESIESRLGAGEWIFLCTDGVRDLQNETQERFADARLSEVLAEAVRTGASPHALLSHALETFGPAGDWVDDACFLVAAAK